MNKYRPETKQAKKERLSERAAARDEDAQLLILSRGELMTATGITLILNQIVQ